MSSDGPPKRDSPFRRHWTVRFTCLLKSFTCGRRVGKHPLCRLVNKRLHGVGRHCTLMYRFHEFGNCCSCLTWSWCRELWIMLHTVKSIHSGRALTFTACVDVTCAKYSHTHFTQVSWAQCWKTFWSVPLNIACVCKCLGWTFHQSKFGTFHQSKYI